MVDSRPLALGRFLTTNGVSLTVKGTVPLRPEHALDAGTLHGGGAARILLQDPFRAAWDAPSN